jgi:hypothetical protein
MSDTPPSPVPVEPPAKLPFVLWVCRCGKEVTARQPPATLRFCKCATPVWSKSDGPTVGQRIARLNRSRATPSRMISGDVVRGAARAHLCQVEQRPGDG